MKSKDSAGSWLFVGAGNMGGAIAAGAISAGVLRDQDLAAVDPSAPEGDPFRRVFQSVGDASAWLSKHGDAGVVLAVKPQMLGAVASAWKPVLDQGPSRLVVSIMAGLTAPGIARAMGEHARVVRVMPNTPIRHGMGMSAVCAGPKASEDDLARVERLFGASGQTMRIEEGLMDAFTGLAGSGPAYVFYMAEAMVEAAEQLGFDRERALTIVRQTVAGAGELLRRSPEDPRALRTAVTSKGGTTAAGTGVLDDAGVHDAVVRAVHAARHRGVQLAGGE